MSRNLYQPKSINYNKIPGNANIDGNLTVNGDTTIEGKLSVAVESGITLTNNVAGATIDVPPATTAWFPVRVNFSVNGAIRLPSLSQVPYNYEYIFYRPIPGTPGNVAATNLVAIIPQAGETINGKQFDGNNNGLVFLVSVVENFGTSVRIRRVDDTWISTGAFSPPVLDAVNASVSINPWAGTKIININGSGRTITLPPLSNTTGSGLPRGSTVTILSLGANTVAAGATGRFYGRVNGVTLNNAASFNMLANESCILMVQEANIWIIH